MKGLIVCVLLTVTAMPALAEQTDFYDGRLSVMVPDGYPGFARQTQEETDRAFPGADHAFISGDGNRFFEIRILSEPSGGGGTLSIVGQHQANQMEQREDRRIRRQGLVEISGREWYAVAFVSRLGPFPMVGEARLARLGEGRIVMVTAMMLARNESVDHDAVLLAILDSLVVR